MPLAPAGVPGSLHLAYTRRLGQLVWWLYCDIVIPLLRTCFYVTETEPYKMQVFYYR